MATTYQKEDIEERVRSEISLMSDNELNKLYDEVVTGARAYVNSCGSVRNIKNFAGDGASLIHSMAYSHALDTYNFTKQAIERGVDKLKVKKDSRHSEYVDTEKMLLDAVRRISVLEEYARRN